MEALSQLGRGLQIMGQGGRLAHFDLSIAGANFEAGLGVNGWSVEYLSVFQIEPGSVIWTHDAVIHQLSLRKRPAKVGTRVGQGEETACATDEQDRYALNHCAGWLVVG